MIVFDTLHTPHVPASLIGYAFLCLFLLLVRVLKALTRKFKLHDDVSLNSVAERCPPNFTGADMYALCADAWFHAAKRQVRPIYISLLTAQRCTDFIIIIVKNLSFLRIPLFCLTF